jgi:hypothetical protein
MYELKEAVVEQKQGQPWKVEKVCDDFNSADLARKNILVNSKDVINVKVKFLPSMGKFVVKSRKPEQPVVEALEEKTSKKKTKKQVTA